MKYAGTPLDMLEASTLANSAPLMYAHFIMEHAPNDDTLYDALCACNRIVPELFTRYDVKKNSFHSVDVCREDVLKHVSEIKYDDLDIEKGPQIFIQIKKRNTQTHMCIALSHVVSDGAGYKQFLMMLSSFYNKKNIRFQNQRNMNHLFFLPLIQRHHKHKIYPLYIEDETLGNMHYIEHQSCEITSIIEFAHQLHVTVNDILLYAYIQALYAQTGVHHISIPCPADLRSYIKDNATSSITNFTGGYYITIHDINAKKPLDIINSIHEQMLRNRAHDKDVRSIDYLYKAYQVFPKSIIRAFVKHLYKEREISYTNTGIWKKEQLALQGCELDDFYITTRFRRYPALQVSISTFDTTLHLTCSGYGDEKTAKFSDHLLKLMLSCLEDLKK